MIEKAAYWKSRADHTYTIQITAFSCKKTKKQIWEEMVDWELSASGYSTERQILIFKKQIKDAAKWQQIKKSLSFSKILEKVEG